MSKARVRSLYRFWLLIALVAMTAGPVSTLAQEVISLSRYYDGDRFLFCFEVPTERVRQLPQWDGKGNPPVSIDEAKQIGAKYLATRFPLAGGFSTSGGEIQKMEVRFYTLRRTVWYYQMDYQPYVAAAKSRDELSEYVAVVLLDGKVVPLKKMGCAFQDRLPPQPK